MKGRASQEKLLTELFSKLEIDEKKGTLSVQGVRLFILPVKFFHSIKSRLVDEVGTATASVILYDMGKQTGKDIIRLMEKAGFPLPKSTNELQFNISIPSQSLGIFSGSGTTKLVELDMKKKFARIQWKDGISGMSRKGKVPVCHFTRGAVTGAMEAWWGSRLESLEVLCEGKGDETCEAVIGTSRSITKIAEGQ